MTQGGSDTRGCCLIGWLCRYLLRNVSLSGVVPQISAIMGPCAGGSVYSPALTDFLVMVEKTSYMFITGPEVVKTVTHEEVTKEQLGGASTHAEVSGVTHFSAPNEESALMMIRELLSFLPQNNSEEPPRKNTTDSPTRKTETLDNIIPPSSNQPYDIKEVITAVVDENYFFEVQKDYAANIVVGFGRLQGKTIGVVANQPAVNAGALDIDASLKAARFCALL